MLQSSDLKRLSKIRGLCLTIFEPLTYRSGRSNDPASSINLAANSASLILEERGLDEESRREFIRPVTKLAQNTDWTAHRGSVMIFRSPGFTKADFWPEVLESRVRVSDEFFILPLIDGISIPRDFWLLALSLNRPRLFRGTAHDLVQVDVGPDMPRDINSYGGFDTPDHDLEGRSSPGAAAGHLSPIRFGTLSTHEAHNRYVHDFLKKIDRAIRPVIRRNDNPLILAGVERELATYREVNTYHKLVDDALIGSPARMTDSELHDRALTALSDYHRHSSDAPVALARVAEERQLLIRNPEEVLTAIAEGRVERLFVDPMRTRDLDWVNSAALDVIRGSGSVFSGGDDKSQSGVMAQLRYRLPNTAEACSATAADD